MSFKCNQTKREVIWRVFVSVISDALGSDLVGRLKPPLRCKYFLLLNFVYMHHLLVSRTYRAARVIFTDWNVLALRESFSSRWIHFWQVINLYFSWNFCRWRLKLKILNFLKKIFMKINFKSKAIFSKSFLETFYENLYRRAINWCCFACKSTGKQEVFSLHFFFHA